MKTNRKRNIDMLAIGGLLAGAACIVAGQVLEGGTIGSIVQPTAALIVFGGALGATLASFSRSEVVQAARDARAAFMEQPHNSQSTADAIVRCSRLARAHGVLALEEQAERLRDPLFRKALRLAVDGTDARQLREVIEIDIANHQDHDDVPARVFEALGGYAPTFGILGAVLGLIHVMQNLAEPARLGSGIATAFVATVYGVGAANLVFLPIASRLRQRAAAAALRHEMILEGVLAIQEGLNPRLLEEKLQTYWLPAAGARQRMVRAA